MREPNMISKKKCFFYFSTLSIRLYSLLFFFFFLFIYYCSHLIRRRSSIWYFILSCDFTIWQCCKKNSEQLFYEQCRKFMSCQQNTHVIITTGPYFSDIFPISLNMHLYLTIDKNIWHRVFQSSWRFIVFNDNNSLHQT